MEDLSPQEELQTDAERIALVEQTIIDVREGRITKTADVYAALNPLGSHFGPMGCSSTELEIAIGKLRIECDKKKI